MENNKMQTEQKQHLEIASKPNLIAAMEVANKQQISLALRQFKEPSGVIKFNEVLSIPTENRITQMAANDFGKVSMIIVAGLTLAFEGMNLKRGMNAIQILDLSEAIIDTAAEDNLALEDLMLFLQKLVRGEYAPMYESIDIPKFMEKFEIYREERHQQLHRIRYEKESNYKSMGDAERTSKTDELGEHFSKMANRLSSLNSQLKKVKDENKNLKMDKF